jgi:hypothetical protein
MEAGPSNPQQGCVGTKRAKVQRKTRIAGTIRGLTIWTLSPECKNLGWQTLHRDPPVGSSDTSGLSAVQRWGRFFWPPSPLLVWMQPNVRHDTIDIWDS